MRIGIVIDASVDIPRSLIKNEHITIIPQRVHSPLGDWEDVRDEDITASNYQQLEPYLSRTQVKTSALSPSVVRDDFLAPLIARYDHLVCCTVKGSLSQTNIHVQQAANTLMEKHGAQREAAGHWQAITTQVVDTRSSTSGAGLVAIHAMDARKYCDDPVVIQKDIAQAIEHNRTFMLFQEPTYVKSFAKKNNKKEVIRPMLSTLDRLFQLKPILCSQHGQVTEITQALGFERASQKLFHLASEAIKQPLIKPLVNLSFAGSFDQLHQLPGHQAFAKQCRHQGIVLHESMLSLTGAVHAGLGTLTISLA